MCRFLVVIALVFLVNPVCAKEIAGVSIDEKVVNSEGANLALNGAGIRTKLFFNIYIAQLYLENQQKDAQQAISDEGAKQIIMHFLYDKVSRDKIVDGWNEGFSANVDVGKLNSLQARIDEFNAMFDEDLVEGDKVIFEYIPGKGTQVTIKSKKKGTIEGKDFNDALLSIWIGKAPISSDLRQKLLQP